MEKCELCDNDATVHEIDAQKNVKIHLCAECAIAQGYESMIPKNPPVTEMLTQFEAKKDMPKPTSRKATCDTCKTTFARFRKTGLVGCPDCYEIFAHKLDPLIIRSQGGANSHIGRVPTRSEIVVDRQILRRQLVEELDRAVAAEQYERAAKLRDQLTDIATTGPGAAE